MLLLKTLPSLKLDTVGSDKRLKNQEPTQQFTVLEVPFQKVSLDYNAEMKIADRENCQRYSFVHTYKKIMTKRETKIGTYCTN